MQPCNANGLHKAAARYGRDLRLRWVMPDDWGMLESFSPDLPLKRVKKEFQLAERHEYMAQCTRMQQADVSS